MPMYREFWSLSIGRRRRRCCYLKFAHQKSKRTVFEQSGSTKQYPKFNQMNSNWREVRCYGILCSILFFWIAFFVIALSYFNCSKENPLLLLLLGYGLLPFLLNFTFSMSFSHFVVVIILFTRYSIKFYLQYPTQHGLNVCASNILTWFKMWNCGTV